MSIDAGSHIKDKIITIYTMVKEVNRSSDGLLSVSYDQVQVTPDLFKELASGETWDFEQYHGSIHASAIIEGVKFVTVFS